jgi:hypothetical protein
MQNDDHEFLNHYMKDKVIDIDKESESPDDSDSSHGDEHYDKQNNKILNNYKENLLMGNVID